MVQTGITSSPATVNGLVSSTQYTITMTAINAYSTSSASSSLVQSTVNTAFSSIAVTSGWNAANLDVSGTSVYNGNTYTVYSFRNGPAPAANSNTVNSYTLTYTCTTSTYINCLLVGGGGNGSWTTVSSGGGAGGVVMKSVLLPPGTNQTITVNVGAGGYGGAAQYNGSNSSIVFGASISSPSLISNTLTAFGGGAGGAYDSGFAAKDGGSGGGGGRFYLKPPGNSVGNSNGTTSNYNWGNPGGISNILSSTTSGGGGAGGPGFQGTDAVSVNGCAGGPGIQCTLPGISQFTPAGFSAYGTYYWGGGGSGASLATGTATNYGRGGIGGGGGSWGNSVYPNGTGGITVNATTGKGSANTGGGGGGTWTGTTGTSGDGGSGIVVIAFPTFPVAADMTPFTAVNSFASANVLNLPVGVTYGGVAVSLLQDKLLVACNAGVYCYTSANSGASWTLLSTLSSSAFRCCALSADGTKGVVAANVGLIYFVDWNLATPTMASFDATSRTYGGISMTPDGYTITVTDSVNNWYSNWNGTTYTALSLPTDVISTVGLMNYYKFDTADVSGNIKNYATGLYDASMQGTSRIDTTTKKFGTGSFYTNGAANNTTNYCTLPGFTFNGTTGMTVAFWTYVTGYAIGNSPFKIGINSSAQFNNATYYGKTMRPYYGSGTANQNPITRFVVDTDGNDMAITGSSVTILNQWNHLVYVFTGTTLTMYVNGTLYGSVIFSAVLQDITYAWFIVGGDNIGNGGQQAYFDEFRAYSRQITAGEVSALYNWNNTTNLAAGSVGIAVSPDGNNMVSVNTSGTEYTSSYRGILNSVNITGPSGNAKGMCFLGGGQTGGPTNFLLASGSGTAGTLTTAYSMYLYQWDNSANALNNPQIILNNWGGSVENTSLTPCGAQGNVVYYLQNSAGSGSSCYVSTLTLGTTTSPSGFDILNPVLGVSTITFGAFDLQYCNVCCSTNGNYVYVMQKGSGNTYDLYSSSNGGLSFSRASSTTVTIVWTAQLVCDGTGQYVWYTGENTPIFYSYNYGVTFTKITTAISYAGGIAVSRDGTKVMVSGQNVVAYSSNGTATTPTFTAGTQTGGASTNAAYITSSATGQFCYYPNTASSLNMVFSSDFGRTYISLSTPTALNGNMQSIGCDTTGQYVAYISSALNVCYVSNNYGATWTLLNTTAIPSATLRNLRLFVTSTYIYVIMSGANTTPFTNNLYGGYSLISGCTVSTNWTWTTLRSDMRYAGITISDTGIIYVVGESQVLVGKFKDVTVFPINNLVFDFTTLAGTSTTTSGANLTTWNDLRTGRVGSYSSALYRTDVTINGRATMTGAVTMTYGNTTTPQNSWTWYCVVRYVSGSTSFLYSSTTNNLRIGQNGGTGNACIATCIENVAWNFGAASVSGGTQTTWLPTANTNYIFTIICSGSSPNSVTSTQTYTYRINGVDYTPASNTAAYYYYLYNWSMGTQSFNLSYIGEQILFRTNHHVATAQTMEQYLSNKWGIGLGSTSTVIASSPYNISPIATFSVTILNNTFAAPTMVNAQTAYTLGLTSYYVIGSGTSGSSTNIPQWNVSWSGITSSFYVMNERGGYITTPISPITNNVVFKSNGGTGTINLYQNIYIPAGNYTLSYYINARSIYSALQVINAQISGTSFTTVSNSPSSATSGVWQNKQLLFSIATSGTYTLTFICANTSSADTTLGLTNIIIY